MRIPIPNRDHRPKDMQDAELREMGIYPDLMTNLWRESTPMEDFVALLEESLLRDTAESDREIKLASDNVRLR